MIPVRIKIGAERRRLYVATPARAKALPELAEAVRPRADDLDVWRFLEDAARADDAVFERLAACAAKEQPRNDGPIVTFRDLGVEWTSGRAHEKHPTYVRAKKTSDLDASRLEYLCDGAPKLGDIRLDRFTLDHALAAMGKLPKTARSQATRRQYAQCIAYVLELAVFPYRLIAASPLPKRFRPRIGEPPEFPYLRPSEDAKLLACKDVPLARRVLYGLLAREGMRLGEALALRFGAFDHEVNSIRVKRPKTKSANEWPPSPGVLAAVKAWQGERPDSALVFAEVVIPHGRHASVLRADLTAAGVKREELFDDDHPVRVHDLRGTCVTLMLANGATEADVRAKTGHTTSAMLARYQKASKSAKDLRLGSLAPLDQAIPELASKGPGPAGGLATKDGNEPRQVASQAADDSRSSIKQDRAEVAEPADAADSKSVSRKGV